MSSRSSFAIIVSVVLFVVAACAAGQPSSERVSFEQAMDLFHHQRWEEAATAFSSVENLEPGKTSALLYQGKALVNLRKFPDAEAALRAFLAAHPRSDDAMYLLAYVRFRENLPTDSLQLFTAAAQLKPPTADDFKVIALDYVLLDDNASAARYLEKAVELDPKNIEAQYHLGRVRYQQNQFEQAMAAFREVLKSDPKNVKAEDNLGLCLEGMNRVEDAIVAYHRAIDLDRSSLVHTEQPYLDLGILLTKLNKAADALPLMAEAEQIAPQSAALHRETGKTYLGLDRLPEAQREVERAVELDPKDPAAHYILGRIYHRLGKADLATQHFNLAEELMRAERAKTGGMVNGNATETVRK